MPTDQMVNLTPKLAHSCGRLANLAPSTLLHAGLQTANPFISECPFHLGFLSWMPASESSCFAAIWCRKNCPEAKNVGGKIGIGSQKFGSAKKKIIWLAHRFMGTHSS